MVCPEYVDETSAPPLFIGVCLSAASPIFFASKRPLSTAATSTPWSEYVAATMLSTSVDGLKPASSPIGKYCSSNLATVGPSDGLAKNALVSTLAIATADPGRSAI